MEILLATMAASILLLGVYGIFHRAIRTRDQVTERIRQTRIRERAAAILRNDLRNLYVSGGVLACTLEGGVENQKSRFPGYLRFTATTGRDTDDAAYGDVQQIEYYISDGSSSDKGPLVRVLTRELLSTDTSVEPDEEEILPQVNRFEVAFYDGQNWQDSWQLSGSSSLTSGSSSLATGTSSSRSPSTSGTSSLPQAIRIRILQTAASKQAPVPPPLELLVPFNSEPFTTSTSSTTGT